MKAKLIKAALLFLIAMSQSSCLFSASRERIVYKRLSKGIINGTIHKGMMSNEIIENFGNPSEKTSPTIYNNMKTQIFIYKSGSNERHSNIYYLYFKNDELIEWKLYK